jgi:SWI/SNF-related matrix-associated actin-dependent regulator of chromatin subfamily A3
MRWRRITLDESHIVRDPSSKGTGAVMAVTVKSTFILSATSIIDSLGTFTLPLAFVGIMGGLEQLKPFNSVIIRMLKSGNVDATFLLQAIMAVITLRHRKEISFIDLRYPKIEKCNHTVVFTEKEKTRYEAFKKQAKGQLAEYNTQGSAGNQKAKAFQTLLGLPRMRQCCNHRQLCGEPVMEVMEQLEKQGTVTLNEETKKVLQDILQVMLSLKRSAPSAWRVSKNLSLLPAVTSLVLTAFARSSRLNTNVPCVVPN